MSGTMDGGGGAWATEAVTPTFRNVYLDDLTFAKLPVAFQRLLDAAAREDATPLKVKLTKVEKDEAKQIREVVSTFRDNMDDVVKWRLLPNEVERHIFVEAAGDLSIRYADTDVKLRAKCWEFFFLYRKRRPLVSVSPEARRRSLSALLEQAFRFPIDNAQGGVVAAVEPTRFEPAEGAAHFIWSMNPGGFFKLRFEAVEAFSDGKVLLAAFKPRVTRQKDIPPPSAFDPKKLVQELKARRGRA